MSGGTVGGATVLEVASAALSEAAERAETQLAELPEPGARTEAERAAADEIKDEIRLLRTRFMEAYAEDVHDRLTEGGKRELRVGELVEAAADAFPGLVPTAAQLAAEHDRAQAGKEDARSTRASSCGRSSPRPGPGATWSTPCSGPPRAPCACCPTSSGPAWPRWRPYGWCAMTGSRASPCAATTA